MHVLVTGAAGMIGQKLVARLVKDGGLNGKPIDRLTLTDVVVSASPAGFSGKVDAAVSNLPEPGEATKALALRPDAIFHLAAVVSGEAETDFEKGYRVNLDGTRALLEAIRQVRRRLQTEARLHFLDCGIRRAVSGDDCGRFSPHAAHLLWHTEGGGRDVARRLQPPRLSRRRRACVFPPYAYGRASPTRRPPASSPASSASRSRARPPCSR